MQTLPPSLQLKRTLAAGGMGEVWLARSETEQRDVAVKVLLSEHARTASFRQGFFDEVALVARLRHPNIVPVYGFGTIGPGHEAKGLPAETPYLVMPLARASLKDVEPTWEAIRPHLRAVLDALAFLHANGVVHRDLKPANVLIGTDTWLSDFGVALQGEREPDDEGVLTGTPAYMAPEQVRGRPRDQGPHTDLYAFAAMVWRLVTGGYVFQGRKGRTMLLAHLTEPVPRLRPRMAVPDGLEAWLKTLLAKEPADRPPTVAAALAAFPALGPPADPRSALPLPPLLSMGAELLDLRPPRFVGRNRSRSAGRALLASVAAGEPCILGVTGIEGIGKTRFVRWLATTGHTTHGFLPVTLASSEDQDLARALIGQLLDAEGLAPPAARPHFRARADVLLGDPEAGERWLTAWSAHAGQRASAERLAAATEVLGAVASRQPVLLGFDGPHPALTELLARVRTLDRPVLTVCLARSTSQLPETDQRWHLGPLSDRSIRRVVASVVRADEVFLDRIAERAQGNPGVALSTLVALWNQGALTSTPRGFTVEGDLVLPDGLKRSIEENARVLRARVEPAVFTALVAAAALGNPVDRGEWKHVCRVLGIAVPVSTMRALTSRGWVARRGRTWSFEPPQLAAALIDEGRRDDTAERAHRAVLEVLGASGADPARLSAVTAFLGDWPRTQVLTQRAVEDRLVHGNYRCGPLLDRHDLAAKHVGTVSAELDAMRLRACWERVRGRSEQAGEILDAAFAQLARLDADGIDVPVVARARLHLERGRYKRFLGEVFDAGEAHATAWRLLVTAKTRHPQVLAEAAFCLGESANKQGDTETAIEQFRRTLAYGDDARPIDRAGALLSLSLCLPSGEERDQAIRDAEAICETHGYLARIAGMYLILGEHARASGRLDAAEAHYREALRRQLELGSARAVYSTINLAMVAVAREDPEGLAHWLALAGPPTDTTIPALFLQLLHLIRQAWAGELLVPAPFLAVVEGCEYADDELCSLLELLLGSMHPDDPAWEALVRTLVSWYLLAGKPAAAERWLQRAKLHEAARSRRVAPFPAGPES